MATKKPQNILQEAEALVFGPRAEAYGHPSDNFLCIATMWEAYLAKRGLLNENAGGLTTTDVAMLNVLQKTARQAHAFSRDNLVDIAGYAATAERLDERRDG